MDLGSVLGIFFFGDDSTATGEHKLVQHAGPIALIFEGLLKSLSVNGVHMSDIEPSKFDAETMMKAFTKVVEAGKVVDAGELYKQKQYYAFGAACGDMISTTVLEGKSFLGWLWKFEETNLDIFWWS